MARFYGAVGYGESVKNPPNSGVWVDQIIEVTYYGDVDRDASRLVVSQNLNADIVMSQSISIVADEYASNNFAKIKYVRWAGSLWTVTNVEVQRPRLILTLGSVYSGPTP